MNIPGSRPPPNETGSGTTNPKRGGPAFFDSRKYLRPFSTATRNDPVAVYHRGEGGEARGRVAWAGLPVRYFGAVAVGLRVDSERHADERDMSQSRRTRPQTASARSASPDGQDTPTPATKGHSSARTSALTTAPRRSGWLGVGLLYTMCQHRPGSAMKPGYVAGAGHRHILAGKKGQRRTFTLSSRGGSARSRRCDWRRPRRWQPAAPRHEWGRCDRGMGSGGGAAGG